MALNFRVHLPDVNGCYEAGLAVGTDPRFHEDSKLPAFVNGNVGSACERAVAWAYEKWSSKLERICTLYCNAAYVCIKSSLIRRVGNQLDGDWREERVAPNSGLNEAQLAAAAATKIAENIQFALTLIVPTKANFWYMNHHTGQGEVQGYTRKVLVQRFGMNVSEEAVTAAHTIGHWASTLVLLSLANVTGIREVSDPIFAGTIAISLSADARMRFDSMPAGIHRLAVAYESAKRLVRSQFGMYCPGVQDFSAIPAERRRVQAFRASFHIGASYLTGQDRADYNDQTNETYLGRWEPT